MTAIKRWWHWFIRFWKGRRNYLTLIMMKLRFTLYLWWQINKSNINLAYIWNSFWGWIKPYFTLRMIPIVLSLWLITNGIWYVIAFAPIGLPLAVRTFAQSYIVFLYSPVAIEKPVILFVSRFVYKFIYRNIFIPVYKVKLIKKLDYERYGLSRREEFMFSNSLTN